MSLSLPPARRCLYALAVAAACLTFLPAAPATAQSPRERTDAERHWRTFIHNVLVARPDRASQAADALLSDEISQDDLLDAVEVVGDDLFAQVARRTTRMDGVSDQAALVYAKIQAARVARATQEERIKADIAKLGATERERVNATRRLQAAGQFAAPYLLDVLIRDDPDAVRLRPYVVRAMSDIGAPLSYPLAVALPNVPSDRQVILCGVLQDAGYPAALPYIKQVLDAQADATGATSRAALSAFNSLRRDIGAPANLTAAELFVLLAEEYYGGRYLRGLDELQGQGVLWYSSNAGDIDLRRTPQAAYADHRAMQAARAALELNPGSDAALALYLSANLRRENRLAGEEDPAYAGKPAAYYATLAGPRRLHEVLGRALDTADPELARDAIESLAQTAGPDLLLSLDRPRQPVLQALTFPDRRVRRRAAMALAQTRPDQPFNDMQLVVPTLAETVRQSDQRYAVVLSAATTRASRYAAALSSLGYVTIPGQSVAEVAPAVATAPAADLVVIDAQGEILGQTLALVQENVKLGGAAILVLTSPADQIRLSTEYPAPAQVTAASRPDDDETLLEAARQAEAAFAGPEISAQDAEAMALEALELIRNLSADPGLFPIDEAEPVLIAALSDERPAVVESAARTLALFPSSEAQQALAEAAAAADGVNEVALLDSLAASARRIGRRAAGEQAEAIRMKIESDNEPVALAAARAYGALSLPTDRSVQAVLED
ncbi:MAG: hypothetical protein AAF612_10985 [Planctomycetota bacterium]